MTKAIGSLVLTEVDEAAGEIDPASDEGEKNYEVTKPEPVVGVGGGRRWLVVGFFRMQQERKLGVPLREYSTAGEIPDGLGGDDQGDGVAGTENGTDGDIAGIMDAAINAGKGHGGGEREHEPRSAPVKEEEHHGDGEAVGGVGGGEAAGAGAAEAVHDVVQGEAGSLAADGVPDGADDEGIAEGDDENQEEGADARPR